MADKEFKYKRSSPVDDVLVSYSHKEEALKLAACDGPPYYYKVSPAGEEAERLLERLNV